MKAIEKLIVEALGTTIVSEEKVARIAGILETSSDTDFKPGDVVRHKISKSRSVIFERESRDMYVVGFNYGTTTTVSGFEIELDVEA